VEKKRALSRGGGIRIFFGQNLSYFREELSSLEANFRREQVFLEHCPSFYGKRLIVKESLKALSAQEERGVSRKKTHKGSFEKINRVTGCVYRKSEKVIREYPNV